MLCCKVYSYYSKLEFNLIKCPCESQQIGQAALLKVDRKDGD